jgi:small-conductance mechanosensitive channel
LGLRLLTVQALAAVLLVGLVSIDARAQTENSPQAEDADAAVARMTDAEVREKLILTMQHQTADEGAGSSGGGVGVTLARLRLRLEAFVGELGNHGQTIVTGLAILPSELRKALRKATGDAGLAWLLLMLAIVLAGAMAAHAAVSATTRNTRVALVAAAPDNLPDRLGMAALHFGYSLLPLAGFALAGFAMTVLLVDGNGPERAFVVTFVTGAFIVLVLAAILRVLIAPYIPALRIIPLSDQSAQFLYRWILVLAGTGTILWLFGGLVILTGMALQAHLVLVLFIGMLMTLLVVAMTLSARVPVAGMILRQAASPVGEQVARKWHWLFILYILLVYALWSLSMLSRGPSAIWPALASLGVIVALPVIDRWIGHALATTLRLQSLQAGIAKLNSLVESETSDSATSNSLEDLKVRQETRQRYARLGRQVARVCVVAAAALMLFRIWGVNFAGDASAQMQAHFWDAMLEVAITIFIAWILWRVATALIDPYLPGPEEDEFAAPGETQPRTRLETLLPVLRKTIFAILAVFTTMIVLSGLGVDIGPLLAGAGVVGLAIGFGAQTLVKDIVSGIFFLIDDAFRVGEYIEFGSIRGEVESIMLRSLKLRHHRGAVHTVPFGELRTVTNYNRDWVIYKMEFRLPADTDVAKVKSLVKQVGNEMLADPVHGQNLLQTLKSQGIQRMEEDAIILRMKFMCKPREQFVLRREAYRRIKQAFAENDINFAARAVRVKTGDGSSDDGNGDATAGAAAALNTSI